MVLQSSSFGFPQQGGYAHNEDRYSHQSHGGSMSNNNAYYGNSSTMQMIPDQYSHGGFSNHNSSHGFGGGSNHASGMYSHSQNGGMNQGYGSHQSSQMSMGPGGYQYQQQRHGHNVSSSPYHYNSSTWDSKDLDD